jgi:hypothetical protein
MQITKHRVCGEIRYYPHNGAEETLPKQSYLPSEDSFGTIVPAAEGGPDQVLDDGEDEEASYSSLTPVGRPSSSFIDSPTTLSPSDALSFQDGRILDVFWSDRLVPESRVDSLPFFPDSRTELAEKERLGDKWRQRIHGSLFFSWHFPISNNKLRLLPSSEDGVQSSLQHSFEDKNNNVEVQLFA